MKTKKWLAMALVCLSAAGMFAGCSNAENNSDNGSSESSVSDNGSSTDSSESTEGMSGAISVISVKMAPALVALLLSCWALKKKMPMEIKWI